MIQVQIIDDSGKIHHCIDEQNLSVSVYNDEIKALNAAESLKPSIILLHYGFRKNGTAEYIALLTNASENSKVVLIAPSLTDDEVINFLVAGAQGYIPCDQLDRFINKAIKVIDEGEAWISRRLTAQVLMRLRNR